MQNTLAQQGKPSTAIHHSLDELSASDLPFSLSVVGRTRSPDEHSGCILFQAIGETLQFLNPTFRHRCEPSIKVFPFSLTNHLEKLLDPLGEGLSRLTCLTNGCQLLSLLFLSILESPHEKPPRLFG